MIRRRGSFHENPKHGIVQSPTRIYGRRFIAAHSTEAVRSFQALFLGLNRSYGISKAIEKVLAKEVEPVKPLFIEEPVLPEKNEALLEITKHTGSELADLRMKGEHSFMSLDVFKLDGRVALITGGNRGLGFAMAKALAEAGADVVLTSRKSEKARESAAAIAEATGRRALGLTVDVTDAQQVESMVQSTLQALGRIDILVNNAGVNVRKPIEEFDEASWDLVQNTNLKAPFLCARAVARTMKAQRYGRVVNVASMLGLTALPERGAYCSSKGGLIQ